MASTLHKCMEEAVDTSVPVTSKLNPDSSLKLNPVELHAFFAKKKKKNPFGKLILGH